MASSQITYFCCVFSEGEAEAEFDILLLTRIMFRPFDCTAAELEQDSDDASRASFKVNEHVLLNFLSLQRMIHKYAQMAGDVVMKTDEDNFLSSDIFTFTSNGDGRYTCCGWTSS